MYSLKDFNQYNKNPRYIREEELNDLRSSLSSLGDLSGFVVNVRTNEIISGNQRSKEIFNHPSSELIVENTYDVKTKTGTVSEGYILYKDERFNIRFVDWDEKTSEIANLRANKYGGSFDFDTLLNEFDTEILLEGGFSLEELTGLSKEELDDLEEEANSSLDENLDDDDDSGNISISFSTYEEAEKVFNEIKEYIYNNYPGAKVSM